MPTSSCDPAVGTMHSLTRRTHRLVIACAVMVTLMVPVEAVLLAALRTPDAPAAARAWAMRLSNDNLQDAALHIQTYPYFYRRAIMTALEPDTRAQVWRRYLTSYAASHPELDVTARALLTRAAAAMTPDVFDDNPPADRVAELTTVFNIGLTVFGRRTATDLFMRLGPDDSSYAALPLTERAANTVRHWVTTYARDADCECSTQFATSCDVSGASGDACAESTGCEPMVTWPMCGVAWAAPCNGTCTVASRTAQ